LKARVLLAFVVALLVLAWALGSLPRSQPGGSLLVNSYWILYIFEALPILGLGALVLLIIMIILYMRGLSDSLGHGIAGKMKRRKKHGALRIMIVIYAWAFALVYLMLHCDGLVCRTSNSNTIQDVAKTITAGSPNPNIPTLQGTFAGLTSLISLGWFLPVFVGLLVVSTIVVGRSLVVGFRESRAQSMEEIEAARGEALRAVEDAIRIVARLDNGDPRTRIINCYQRLITTGSRHGASLTPQQTARELEAAMRRTFLLEGPAISELTALFEEARYSQHPISDSDASTAQQYLADIAEEIGPSPSLPMVTR
jgi:uncharacterized protein DUF4129